MMRTRHLWPVLLVAVTASSPSRSSEPIVEVEEAVTTYASANNGAGPLWCYGAPLVVRHGEDVLACALETGEGVPPLCNTRWQLWRRTELRGPSSEDRWRLERTAGNFREREPCPLGVLPDGTVLVSINPSIRPPGTKYGPCQPTVLRFAPGRYSEGPAVEAPRWRGGTHFTDHSYRGFAIDRGRGEALLLNIDARTSAQHVSFRDADGKWHARGRIEFPIRAAYPQVALREGAAHVLAIGDIREPVASWAALKLEKTGRKWDYVFRRLFYTVADDVRAGAFVKPLEVATVEKTAGHITNLDLHVDGTGRAHLLWLERPHLHAFIRDKFFPGESLTTRLVHATVLDGKVTRRTITETPSKGAGLDPSWARFRVGPRGAIGLVVAGEMRNADGERSFGNFWTRIESDRPATWSPIPLEHPFSRFFIAGSRGGSTPSAVVDLFGSVRGRSGALHYARVRVGDGSIGSKTSADRDGDTGTDAGTRDVR